MSWIKLDRNIITHWVFSRPDYFSAWIYLLVRANYINGKVLIDSELVDVSRGEFITSLQKLSKDVNLSLQSTRTFLTLLEKDGMIVKKSTSKLTRITICKYDSYQDVQHTNNTPATNEQHASNMPVTSVEEVKEYKKEKTKTKRFAPPSLSEVENFIEGNKYSVDAAAFLDFYTSKGWKVGNTPMKSWEAAVRTWNRKNCDANTTLQIVPKTVIDF